jgi:cytochrome c5
MKRSVLKHLVLITSVISSTLVLGQTSTAPKPSGSDAKPPAKAASVKQEDVGQRKFDANCGRCHSFPQQLSPSITGTVVRHMRVRANLSAEDEKDILRFLAP